MRKESELFQWVENLANDGTWESEGRFTLEKDKAWAKLSTYQLPFAQAWVLKLVQAAVLSSTSELRIKQSGSETTFRFVDQTRWNEEDVTQALFSTGSVVDQGLVPLAVAVRYLARSAEKLLSLHYPDGTTQVWDGQAFHTEASPYPTEDFEISIFSAQKQGRRWSLLSGGAAGESAIVGKVLSNLAYVSPIPITVDGRRINGFANDPDAGASSATAPFALMPLKADLHLPEFRFLRDRDWRPESDEVSLRIENLDGLLGESLSCGLLVCLTASVKEQQDAPLFEHQPSFIKWIRDGVIVRAERLPPKGAIGVTLLVSAEGLRTDLSGLNLAQDQTFGVRKKQAMKRARIRLLELADKNVHQSLKINLRGNRHKAAMLTFAGLGLVKPLFLGLAGIAAAQYASDKLRVRRREFQLQDDLIRLCKKI